MTKGRVECRIDGGFKRDEAKGGWVALYLIGRLGSSNTANERISEQDVSAVCMGICAVWLSVGAQFDIRPV